MKPNKNKKHEFWITNISREKDISLADLRLTVRRGESRNLLDSKHYVYTLEQLQASAESGSIKAKSQFIKVRSVPPVVLPSHGIYVQKDGRLVKKPRNHVEIIIPKFDELDFDPKMAEEKFAAEEADMTINDHAPALPVDKQYNQPIQPTEQNNIDIEKLLEDE